MDDTQPEHRAPPAAPPAKAPARRRRAPDTAQRHEAAGRGRRPCPPLSAAAPSAAPPTPPTPPDAASQARRPAPRGAVTPLRPPRSPAARRPDGAPAAAVSWLPTSPAAFERAVQDAARGLDGDELWRFRVTLAVALGADERTAVARVADGSPFGAPPEYTAPALRAALEWLELARDGAELLALALPEHAVAVGRTLAARLDRVAHDERWLRNRPFRFAVMVALSFDTETVTGFLRDARPNGVAYLRAELKTAGLRAALAVVDAVLRRRGAARAAGG